MLSSLLGPSKSQRRASQPFNSSSPYPAQSSSPQMRQEPPKIRHAAADWTETEDEDDETGPEDHDLEEGEELEVENDEDNDDEDDDEGDGEDGGSATPLLPIFSAAHLDSLPVYNLTHAIRLIVLQRCETTLAWDQLRSPQVSQFLVKPMQQQIRTSHFSRATLYALMANCLQFSKEGEMNPGNAGTSRTRAMVCELLAIKLLKEYNTRELIDSLSYDFYPLQGSIPETASWEQKNRPKASAARISTLEVAIRAQAKRFLAHPLVVQQLEAIWAGTIVFHSTADTLHRPSPEAGLVQRERHAPGETSRLLGGSPDKRPTTIQRTYSQSILTSHRRTVTLYDPRDASLFKLSRLRVPRYRQFFSTCSLAVLLGLFLAVLSERSSDITTLELVFWMWSAGFMLDEVVGFNEQGFSLYLMSFWNTFDLGILLLLLIFYCMRIYGLFIVEEGRADWDSMSYDILAANAVLLFPRLFSVLDHYRYFSQLLIAFRLMVIDLIAVFVLILIMCSGFFVAFTLSFGKNEYDAYGVAYSLFQIIMGFTPAAWQAWETYNILGQAILTLFLFITHFLIVTILITVLTNSFMAIVSNANDEHQFVFAVNTISMVKNDALFSYVAPSNLLAWVLSPLRFLISFRSFVKMNRYVIKITHFPILFAIFAYEKVFLATSVYEPTDLVENQSRGRKRLVSFLDPASRASLFSPTIRLREESVAGMQKDRALEEVFRLAPRGDPRSHMKERRKTSNVVNNWMEQHEGIASPPPEQDRSIVDRLERKRQASRRETIRRARLNRVSSGGKSVASDPADLMSVGVGAHHDFAYPRSEADLPPNANDDIAATSDDGDDELLTNEEDDVGTLERRSHGNIYESHDEASDYFRTPTTARPSDFNFSSQVLHEAALSPTSTSYSATTPRARRQMHNRHLSTNTILYNPISHESSKRLSGSSRQSFSPPNPRTMPIKAATGTNTPTRRTLYSSSKPRPILTNRQTFQNFPTPRGTGHRRSSLDMGEFDLNSDFGIDPSAAGGLDANLLGAVPSSFATQMAMAMAKGMVGKARGNDDADGRLMGRIMLARMKTLEEGFQEVVREFKASREGSVRAAGSESLTRPGTGWNSPAELGGERKRDKGKGKQRERVRRSRPGTADAVKQAETERAVSTDVGRLEETVNQTPEEKILAAYAKKGSSL